MVIGVTTGHSKTLIIIGTGYRVNEINGLAVFNVGFSHVVTVRAPTGITFIFESTTRMRVEGNNKQQVGQTAADIRAIRPPEPYKGKGIRLSNEVVLLKQGKRGK